MSLEFPITKLSENIPAHTCCVVVLKIQYSSKVYLYFQNIPAHMWIVRIKNSEFSWNLSLRFIKVLQYVVDAWTYEKFQNSSDIYPYDIKIFHLIHERTKVLEFWYCAWAQYELEYFENTNKFCLNTGFFSTTTPACMSWNIFW